MKISLQFNVMANDSNSYSHFARGLKSPPECQVIAKGAGERMDARLERQDAVIAQSRRPAPHHHIAMFQQNPLCMVAPLKATKPVSYTHLTLPTIYSV